MPPAGTKGDGELPGGAGDFEAENQSPWRRADHWALWILILAALVSLPSFHNESYDLTLTTGDGAVYTLTAQSIAQGNGYQYLGEPFSIRPPGFPLLLIPAIAVLGHDPVNLTWYVMLWGVACVALFFIWLRPRTGTWLAFALAACLWFNPFFQRLCNQVMSDVPGATLLLACLLLERKAARNPSAKLDACLGILIAFSASVRSIVILLLPAICIARACGALRRGELSPASLTGWLSLAKRRWAVLALVVIALQIPWSLRNAGLEQTAPSEHVKLYSYGVAMWHTDIGDPASPRISASDFLERVRVRVSDWSSVLGTRMMEREYVGNARVWAWLACGAWLIVLWQRRAAAEWFAGAGLLVASIYFGFMNRLMLPVYLVFLPACALVLVQLFGRLLPLVQARALVAALVLGLIAHDYDPRWGWQRMSDKNEIFDLICESARKRFGPNRIMAADFGGHLSVQLQRPVYTLRWVLERDGLQGGLDLIEKYGINALVLDMDDRQERNLFEHLKDRDPKIRTVGSYALLRL